MKIIHLADSHLGFSSYSRLDEHGQKSHRRDGIFRF